MRRSTVTRHIKNLLFFTGCVAVARQLGRSHTEVPILRYHSVSDNADYCPPSIAVGTDLFERQMVHLVKHYEVISLDDIVECIRSGRSFPKRAIAITFDDGYLDNYTNAFPVLCRNQLTATFFVAAGPVVRSEMFWVGWLQRLLLSAPDPRQIVEALGLRHTGRKVPTRREYRQAIIDEISIRINRSDLEGRRRILAEVENILADSPVADGGNFMMSTEHIAEMAGAGMCIGSHTLSHPILSSLPDRQAMQELRESKTLLGEIVGAPIEHLAYPNGPGVRNFNDKTCAMAKEAGYSSASTSERGVVTRQSNLFALPRQGINDELGLGGFSFKLEERRFKPILLPS